MLGFNKVFVVISIQCIELSTYTLLIRGAVTDYQETNFWHQRALMTQVGKLEYKYFC